MRKQVLAVIALVLVGTGGLWWWLHRSHTADQPATATAPKPADRAVPKPSRGDEAAAEQQLPILVDDDPRGALRLEGQVVDPEDHPVAGASVVLGSNPPRTATTEADGGFAFDGLVGRPYTLVARASQGIAGPVTARLTARSDPVVLHLRPAAKVTATVVSVDGKPIEGATVELRGVDHQQARTAKGVAVFASVVPGGYQVAAWADGPRVTEANGGAGTATAYAKTLQWIQVGAGETTTKLVLVKGAPVTGRVVDDKGAPVAGARVTFHGASDWSQQADERYDAATSGADGAFKFAAMPAGSFRFVAAHPKFAPGTSTLVTLDGTNERAGVVIAVDPGATVRGRVVDTAQQPVASARVRIGVSSRRMIFDPPRQAYSDDKGNFELHGLPRRELDAVAIHETGSSQTKTVDATHGDVGEVVLLIDRTGTIAGIVVDPTGNPVEGAQVSAGPNFRDPSAMGDFANFRLRGFPQELTDASGKFTLTGLAPGKYSITAMRSHAASRGRRGTTEGVLAETGAKDLKIVLAPEGGVKGKVALQDGTTPPAFTISVGMTQQGFTGGGDFELDALAPQTYELAVRGPTFQARSVDVVVEAGKVADVGTISVEKGRTLAGIVIADGQPVAGATVYAGRQVFGNGTSSAAQFGPMGQSTKQTTSDVDGSFSLAGFNDGDLTIVAEASVGRSKAMRIPTEMPGQGQLVLELQKFGALSGVMRQNGKPVEGVFVSCQSTTTPGALYAVASGADGTFRYDQLAPDTYKVSATVGMPLAGMKFYSKQVDVPSGQEVKVDLEVQPGNVALDVTPVPRSGQLGVASVWLATGSITARTASELSLRMAAAGPGASQWVIIQPGGGPAHFGEVVPGAYSACVVPFPTQVQGMSVMSYVERHGDKLPAFCQGVTVAPSPESQSANVPVDIPPYIADGSGSGSGGHP